MVTRAPRWVSREKKLPTKKDADRHERVWVVCLDANNRPYPSEMYWKAVKRLRFVTHWAIPPMKTWKYPEERVNELQAQKVKA